MLKGTNTIRWEFHRPYRPPSPQPIQDRHLLMAGAQILREQVQVTLGGRDLRMPEDHGEPHDVSALAEVVGRKGVAETVPAKARESDLVLEQIQ